MDENKEINETIEEVVEQVEEIVEQVEETVETVTEAVEESVEEIAEVNEESAEEKPEEEPAKKLTDALNDVKAAVKENAQKLINKLDEANLNEESMKKYVADFTESVNGLVNKAAVKVNEMKQDPKTADFMNKAQQSYEDFASKTKEVVDKTAEKLNEQDIKGTVTKGVEKVKVATANLSDRYQKFVHDPKVQKTVLGAVDTTKAVTVKAFCVLKDLIIKEEKEKEE